MTRKSHQLTWKITLPILALMLFAALPGAISAQSGPPNAIDSVSPDYAMQGETNVLVTITLAASTAPPSQVVPTSVRIGALAGATISRNQLTVTAVFDIPTGASTGAEDVSVEFPRPGGAVVFTKSGAFEIRPGAPAGNSPTTTPTTPATTAATPTASYAVVDTGQTTCYNSSGTITCPQPGESFHGQDAQYAGNQPSFTDNGNGTVTDNVTGLMWQKTPGDKVTWAEAVAGADTFSLAGYDDWRLPTIKELYSLIDFSGVDPSGWNGADTSSLVPFINTDYFDFEYGDTSAGERIIDAQYWSSTEYVGTTMNGDATTFGVNFADGRIKGYGQTNPRGGEMTQFVRYVRGNTDYGVNDFVDNGSGTVTDLSTGLMWVQGDSGAGMTWEEALDYAENLEFAGYDDWRLPNAKELQSIVDYTRSPSTSSSPAIDPIFNTTSITDEGGETNYPFYWTSTTHANWTQSPGAMAVYVAFGEALGWMQGPFGGNYVLMDVHGAGAQRSDPKTGDPADWPHGNGPQGDVIRIYNYVRLVRDADLPGDVDDDGDVDVADIVLVAGCWGCQSGDDCYDERYDLNNDGEIDVLDVMEVSSQWESPRAS